MPRDEECSKPSIRFATVEAPPFGGRLSIHDVDGASAEVCGIIEDLLAVLSRINALPAELPESVEHPPEGRRIAVFGGHARRAVLSALLVMQGALPEFKAELTAKQRKAYAAWLFVFLARQRWPGADFYDPPIASGVECGPVAGVLAFPGAA